MSSGLTPIRMGLPVSLSRKRRRIMSHSRATEQKCTGSESLHNREGDWSMLGAARWTLKVSA